LHPADYSLEFHGKNDNINNCKEKSFTAFEDGPFFPVDALACELAERAA
jgi:hypothetical protein